jgi:enoyl-CoA hydratase/carnithine racemase
MPAQLKSHTIDQTLILTISDPENRNALGPAIYAAGTEALNAADSNSQISSVIITGEGAHFCAGGNLNRLKANRELPKEHQAQSIDGLNNWMETIRSFPKPVIAAVEGAAAGAGFSLCLMCDLIVASQSSVFATSYNNVALSPDGGVSWHLSRLLPRQLATRWLLLGERISAEELHARGLIYELTQPGQAFEKALELCQVLNQRAKNSSASIKELINASANQDLIAHMHMERDHFVENLHHDNAGIGIDAFLNKQTPRYK